MEHLLWQPVKNAHVAWAHNYVLLSYNNESPLTFIGIISPWNIPKDPWLGPSHKPNSKKQDVIMPLDRGGEIWSTSVMEHQKLVMLCSMLWPLNAAHTKKQHTFIIRRRGTGGVSHNQDNEWLRVMVVKLRRVTASQSGAGFTAISRTKHLNKTSCFHFVGKTFFFHSSWIQDY